MLRMQLTMLRAARAGRPARLGVEDRDAKAKNARLNSGSNTLTGSVGIQYQDKTFLTALT